MQLVEFDADEDGRIHVQSDVIEHLTEIETRQEGPGGFSRVEVGVTPG